MKEAIDVFNRMVEAGVIGAYAISDAVAAYNYIEASITEDLDILVSFDVGGNRAPTNLMGRCGTRNDDGTQAPVLTLTAPYRHSHPSSISFA